MAGKVGGGRERGGVYSRREKGEVGVFTVEGGSQNCRKGEGKCLR